jgi:hypothetical protein
MATKKKISIPSIIAAISFIYLAFCPYIINPIFNILLGHNFNVIIRIIVNSIFNFGNIINFLACLITAVGIFTKFDKIAVAITSALFWLSSLVTLISGIINSIKYGYFRMNAVQLISLLSNMLSYFLIFAIALGLTILFFKKKETPKFLKIVAFIPVIIFALILFFAFLNDALHIFSLIVDGVNIGYILNTLLFNALYLSDDFALVIGFGAVMAKLTDLKKKPKNTVEISENIVVENATNE